MSISMRIEVYLVFWSNKAKMDYHQDKHAYKSILGQHRDQLCFLLGKENHNLRYTLGYIFPETCVCLKFMPNSMSEEVLQEAYFEVVIVAWIYAGCLVFVWNTQVWGKGQTQINSLYPVCVFLCCFRIQDRQND